MKINPSFAVLFGQRTCTIILLATVPAHDDGFYRRQQCTSLLFLYLLLLMLMTENLDFQTVSTGRR